MITNKITKVFAGFVVALVAFGMLASSALAATTAQLTALGLTEAQASAIIMLFGGNTTTTASAYTHTMTLRQGMSGASVSALQAALNSVQMPAITVDGKFGPATAAAVRQFQASQGLAADGIVGPNTGASLSATTVDTTDVDEAEETTGTGSSATLSGGAGSLDDASYVSGLSNEDVGEGAEDVAVMGMDIEADNGSDIEIVAVRLDFSPSTGVGSNDLDDYLEEVAISLDGEVFARIDADEFEDDNNFDKTITLDRGAIIEAGDEGRLVVHATGISNLDSNDTGNKWTVDLESVRFRDASGAVITDSSTGDIDKGGKTFTMTSFASAADAELKVSIANDNPDAMIVNADLSNDTEGVELLKFTLEAEGDSDLRIRDFPIFLTTSETDLEDVVNTVYITIDGEEFSESVSSTTPSITNVATITFEDFDYTIGAGNTVDVVIAVDVNALDNTGGVASFAEGTTLKADVTSAILNLADAEDESGEDLVSGDRSGTALGEAMAFYDVAPMIELVGTPTASVTPGGSTAFDDTGTFTIKYKVTALDGDVWVSDSAVGTTLTSLSAISSDSVIYTVDKSGTATSDDVSGVVSFISSGNNVVDAGSGNGVKITEGSTGTFTLTIQRTNNNAGDSGLFRAVVRAISWGTSAATVADNLYTFNLDEYETDYVSIN